MLIYAEIRGMYDVTMVPYIVYVHTKFEINIHKRLRKFSDLYPSTGWLTVQAEH